MTVYFIVSILALTASAFIFFENVIVSSASIVSVILIGVSILQAVIFKMQENEEACHTNNTAYSTHEIDYEAVKLSMKYHTIAKLAIVPMLCIFIIYFNSVCKIVFPVCIYLLSFLPVRLLVKHNQK